MIPFTVVTTNSSNSTQSVMQHYASDDVWATAFSSCVYLQSSVNYGPLPAEGSSLGSNVSSILSNLDTQLSTTLPPGPYFISTLTGKVCKPYRLYSDYSQAFLESLWSDSNGTLHTVQASIYNPAALAIAVPSRLYYQRTTDKPLAGVRIGIKDLFDLQGRITNFGDRAYASIKNLRPLMLSPYRNC